jgi:hypothetical protein
MTTAVAVAVERASDPTRATFWLYQGETVLASVRLHVDATAREVKALAIAQHDRVPLPGYGCAPFEWRLMLARAEVRR